MPWLHSVVWEGGWGVGTILERDSLDVLELVDRRGTNDV